MHYSKHLLSIFIMVSILFTNTMDSASATNFCNCEGQPQINPHINDIHERIINRYGSGSFTEKGFLEYCVNRDSETPEIQHTVKVLLDIAGTDQCDDANRILKTKKEMILGGKGIKDISPINDFTELRELRLWNNQIEDISSLENLTNLKVLDLRRNNISYTKPLESLINLEELVITSNPISDTSSLEKLTGLKVLYASDLKTRNISFLSKLPDLEVME